MTTAWLLYLVGLAFILAEVFIPGGIVGILGGCAIIASLVILFSEGHALQAWMMIAGVAVVVPLAIMWWLRRVSHSQVLSGSEPGAGASRYDALVGETGQALCNLHPTGLVRIRDQKVDVVTTGEFLDKGATVQVVEVSGNRVVVKQADPQGPGEESDAG